MKNKSSMYKTKELSLFYYFPMLLIAGFVPLIVYGKYINLEGTTQFLYWTGVKEMLDFFSYWKSRWVIILTAISLFTYLVLLISKKTTLKKEYKYYIPLGIYALCVVISTIFAIDVPTALNGFVDMYQGMWVLLSYVIITFLMINLINGEREIKWFLNAFIFLIIAEGLIGVGQYFGFDIFNTKFGNATIIPSGVTVDGGLTFNFGKHTIYGTLFNTNYVGSFATLMLPMAVAYLVLAKTKKTRIIGIVALILCIFTWLGCNSRAGYVGVVFGCIVAAIMLRKYVVKYWRVSVSVVAVAMICFIGMNALTDSRLINRVKTMNVFSYIEQAKQKSEDESIFRIYSIDVDGNTIDIKTSHENIKIKVDGENLFFLDENDKTLPTKILENGNLVADIPTGVYIQVKINNKYPGFTVSTPWEAKGQISFYISNNKISAISNAGMLTRIENAKHLNKLNGLDSFMSGRGYIWSRALPLIKYNIVKGCGPDNFIYAFPQNDYIAKMNANMAAYTVTDKPHNMYLQIAINTGIISMLTFLVLCFMYILTSIMVLRKFDNKNNYSVIGLSCFISVIGYLFAGIFNDNVVSVAPLFFIILGLGISININLYCKGKENVKDM